MINGSFVSISQFAYPQAVGVFVRRWFVVFSILWRFFFCYGCSWNYHFSISKLYIDAGYKCNDPFNARPSNGWQWCKFFASKLYACVNLVPNCMLNWNSPLDSWMLEFYALPLVCWYQASDIIVLCVTFDWANRFVLYVENVLLAWIFAAYFSIQSVAFVSLRVLFIVPLYLSSLFLLVLSV